MFSILFEIIKNKEGIEFLAIKIPLENENKIGFYVYGVNIKTLKIVKIPIFIDKNKFIYDNNITQNDEVIKIDMEIINSAKEVAELYNKNK